MAGLDNVYDTTSFFKTRGIGGNATPYPNPFYNIANQYVPPNVEQQIKLMDHLLLRNGFLRAAISRIISYFINELVIECDDTELQEKYKELFETLGWKEILSKSGLDLVAYSNSCLSVTQGFDRFLKCDKCGNAVNIEKVKNFTFNKGKYGWKCVTCGSLKTDIEDVPSKDPTKLMVKHWPLQQLKTRHEPITGQIDYFWEIDQPYIKNLNRKDNKFYAMHTPKSVMDCVFAKGGPKLFKLNKSNLLHLKIAHPSSIETDGKAIPLGMFMFDDFYNYQVVKRFNEAIMYEDIVPFRFFSMLPDNNPQSSPVFNQSGRVWKASVLDAITNHKQDPASYQTFPFPINYQNVGGQGKALAPVEIMQQYKADILGSYNIPQELFNMNLQLQTAGPALRLFENAWAIVPESLNKILQHMADIFSKIYSWEKVKVKMLDVTTSDDMERKSILNSLISNNIIAKTTALEMYNLNYKAEVKKKLKEDRDVAELQREEQEKDQLEQANDSSIFNQQNGGGQVGGQGGQPGGQNYDTAGMSPSDVNEKSQEIAQQLVGQQPSQIRETLQEIKTTNTTLYAAVKAQLDQLRSQAKSQGNQQMKQNAGQQNG